MGRWDLTALVLLGGRDSFFFFTLSTSHFSHAFLGGGGGLQFIPSATANGFLLFSLEGGEGGRGEMGGWGSMSNPSSKRGFSSFFVGLGEVGGS